jgi:hypothetical protein
VKKPPSFHNSGFAVCTQIINPKHQILNNIKIPNSNIAEKGITSLNIQALNLCRISNLVFKIYPLAAE